MDEDIYPDELYHYGRKGMKWGQHIFGKERPAGRSRKKKSEDVENRFVSGAKSVASKVSSSRAKAKEDKRVQKLKKKKISDMTDDELAEYTDRMNREKLAKQARNNARTLDPQNVSKGQSFILSIGRDVIAPTAKTVGKQYLEKVLKDRLGLNDTGKNDPFKELRDKVDKAELENRLGRATEEMRKRDTEDPLKDLRDEVDRVRLESQRATFTNTRDKQQSELDQRQEEADMSTWTGKHFEQNVQRGKHFARNINTDIPIAGLLPAPKDDRYR